MKNGQKVNQINEFSLRFSLSYYQLTNCIDVSHAAILA